MRLRHMIRKAQSKRKTMFIRGVPQLTLSKYRHLVVNRRNHHFENYVDSSLPSTNVLRHNPLKVYPRRTISRRTHFSVFVKKKSPPHNSRFWPKAAPKGGYGFLFYPTENSTFCCFFPPPPPPSFSKNPGALFASLTHCSADIIDVPSPNGSKTSVGWG